MTKVSELHEKWMKDPKYREAYEASQPQYELISALLDARSHAGIDQEELARRMGHSRLGYRASGGLAEQPVCQHPAQSCASHRHQAQGQLRARRKNP